MSRPPVVAIYAGPPSAGHISKISIRQQVNRCWNYSKSRGWKVNHVFVDQGRSESLVKRTNFRNMLIEANTGKFGILVLFRLEYFCSARADFIAAEKSIRKSRITLHNVAKTGGQSFGGFGQQG